MATVIIDKYGVKRYFNDRGMLHREDGPAVIWPNGGMEWYKKNEIYFYRRQCGRLTSYVNGRIHSRPNGHIEHFIKGVKQWPRLK